MLDQYVYKNNKKMRMGYTTGSCAAAASKAAAWMLLHGQILPEVELMTPKGIGLHLEVLEPKFSATSASCAIRKDAGDDPDVTDGLLIYATVSRTAQPGVTLDGGEGVGRVTRTGLEQAVGDAAINKVPRQMIRENDLAPSGPPARSRKICVFRRSVPQCRSCPPIRDRR